MITNPWTKTCRSAWRSFLGLAMMTAIGSGATGAEPLPTTADDDFTDLPTLHAEELRTLRGGFEYAGLKFDFAAFLRTFVDGRLALETLITYTDSGPVTEHRSTPPPNTTSQPVPSTTPPTATVPPDVGETVQLLEPGQDLTPSQSSLSDIDLSELRDSVGILINDRKGEILALHEVTREHITSMVVNRATGRDIRQELNISVTVENFKQLQDSLRDSILNSRISALPQH